MATTTVATAAAATAIMNNGPNAEVGDVMGVLDI
jgi:hypothetical protein